MATKNKHRTKAGAAGLFSQAYRCLEKGDFKQALKGAKVCHRQQPSPDTRRLLEQAYLGRAQQLYRVGLRDECRATVEGLLQLGVTEASVQAELPELLIATGLFDRAAATVPKKAPLEDDTRLLASAADHAVLRPEVTPAALPAIRQGAVAVRRALAALEADKEAEALALLKGIPRASPLSDWKYFVRGLAAYYRNEAAERQANWERLDPERFAARVAAALTAVIDPTKVKTDDYRLADKVARLGNEVCGGPALASLQKLQGHLAAGRWRPALKEFRAGRRLWQQLDPALPQRVAMVLYETLARKGALTALRELTTLAEPPAIDLHWNRALAIACEHADDDDEMTQTEQHWRAYLADLAGMEDLFPADRNLAQALVWLRLGRLLVEESCPVCPTCNVRHEPDEDLQARAIECLEGSLNLAPELLPAYEALAEAFQQWQEPDRAAATYRRLIERFPEDLDALLRLANHHLDRDEPFAARDLVLRARRLKPLDTNIKRMVVAVHLASARQHAIADRWGEGRAELAAAEEAGVQFVQGYRLLVYQAVLEFKAGDFGLAHRLIDRARNELGESAPVLLLMTIEGIRHDLPKGVTDELESRWLTTLKKGRTSLAAGEMCRIMGDFLLSKAEYPGQADHAERLLGFLHRCSRAKWQPHDLRRVLEFVLVWAHREEKRAGRVRKSSRGDADKLLARLVPKARAKFPDNAFFQFIAGELEIRKGPLKCDPRLARDCFERAVELTEGATDPDNAQLARRAKDNLHMLDRFEGLSLDRAGPVSSPFAAADDDDDGDEEDYSQFDPFAQDDADGGPVPDLSPDQPPAKLFQAFVRVCRQLGLDPQQILDDAAAGKPFRFRPGDSPAPRRGRRR